MKSEQRNSDGSYQCWDFDAYMAYKRAREQSNMFVNNHEIVGHPKVGKHYAYKDDGTEYVVESVHKHWLGGFYEYAVCRRVGTKSHGTAIIANINSIDDLIIGNAEEFNSSVVWL